MSGLEARIAEVLAGHKAQRLDEPASCSCGWAMDWRLVVDDEAGIEWAKSIMGQFHAHVAAMLAPLIREAQEEAFKRGFDDAHNQHAAHRERRNQPHPGIAYNNPYRSNDE